MSAGALRPQPRSSAATGCRSSMGCLCTREGLPIAVEVFEGNTADPTTLTAQIDKLKEPLRDHRVVLVGDRGMITKARICEDLVAVGPGLDYVPARAGHPGPGAQRAGRCSSRCSRAGFSGDQLARAFPGERLIVCRNRELADERARKREELLAATEKGLSRDPGARSTASGSPLRGAGRDRPGGRRSARTPRRWPSTSRSRSAMATSPWRRKADADRGAKPGSTASMSSAPAVPAEDLERCAKRSRRTRISHGSSAPSAAMKTVDLEIRPIRHWNAERVRAHVFLCMLAYHVEWHLRQALSPLLFHDTRSRAARAARSSPVGKTEPSPEAAGQEGDQAQRRWPPRHELRRPDRPSRHAHPQHRAPPRHPEGPSPSLFTPGRHQLQEAAFKLLDIDPCVSSNKKARSQHC